MAVRRTKEEKYQAEQRRLEELEGRYSLDEAEVEAIASDQSCQASDKQTDLLAYSPQLIKKDLRRTAISTALVFLALVALYFSF